MQKVLPEISSLWEDLLRATRFPGTFECPQKAALRSAFDSSFGKGTAAFIPAAFDMVLMVKSFILLFPALNQYGPISPAVDTPSRRVSHPISYRCYLLIFPSNLSLLAYNL